MRVAKRITIPVVMLTAAAVAGGAIQGWAGVFLWPLAVCLLVLEFVMAAFVVDLFVTYGRHRDEVRRIRARMRPLSNEQLRDLCANPSRRESGSARVELMRRGLDARPPREQLFEMLMSGNSDICGQAMVYVQMFYPESRELVPLGSSNHDPPEIWRARVAALRIHE